MKFLATILSPDISRGILFLGLGAEGELMALSEAAATSYVEETFSDTGNSDEVVLRGKFDLSIQGGTTCTVIVQKSWDGGTTWEDYITKTSDYVGVEDASWGIRDVLYRLRCSVYGSGTLVCRLNGRKNLVLSS